MQFRLSISDSAKPGEKTEVKIECYYDRRYRYRNTGVYIDPEFFDKSKRIVSNRHPQSAAINYTLKEKIRDIENAAIKYELVPGCVFDFNALKNFTGGKDKQSFCDFISSELKKEVNLEYNSLVKYEGNIEIIKSVIGDLPAEKLNGSHIAKLDKEFRAKYARSTVARLHIFIQKYIKKAIKKRLLQANPYDVADELQKFKPEKKTAYHTIAELDALASITGLTENIELIRDRYLYSCYTGLRISDNLALLKSALTDSKDGYVVDLTTIKYANDLIHPLGLMFDGAPDKIVRKWIGKHDGETVFPVQSREYIRTVLALLADMAGIKKHLHFHVARHTCASLLADISQNPFLIMNILGHRDIKTSMGYIHASPEGIKKQFRNLADWKEKAR